MCFQEHSVIFTKYGLLISQGSAATYLGCGGHCYISLVPNFIALLTAKEIWRYITFWQSDS